MYMQFKILQSVESKTIASTATIVVMPLTLMIFNPNNSLFCIFLKDLFNVCLGALPKHYKVYIEGVLNKCLLFVSDELMAKSGNLISVVANLTADCTYRLQIESINEVGRTNTTSDFLFGTHTTMLITLLQFVVLYYVYMHFSILKSPLGIFSYQLIPN